MSAQTIRAIQILQQVEHDLFLAQGELADMMLPALSTHPDAHNLISQAIRAVVEAREKIDVAQDRARDSA